MNVIILILITVLAGVAIAFQSTMSGQLGKMLGNPFLATFSLYSVSAVSLCLLLLGLRPNVPDRSVLQSVPAYLWFAGSLLSIIALSAAYWIMPKLGVGRVMAGVVTGQIITSMLVSHFAWFGLPENPLTVGRLLGASLLLAGVFLINSE